jgi:hypothetical protein
MKTFYLNYETADDFSLVFEKRIKAQDFAHADFLASQMRPDDEKDYLYSVHDISNYYYWRKNNVIKTKDGYLTQCTQYRKVFTKKDLFAYFVREYAPQF